MSSFTIDEIQDALERPKGRRAIEPTLRAGDLRIINFGDFIKINNSYLHHGFGGFAVVYRVRDETNGKEVALRCWRRSELPSGTKLRSTILSSYLTTNPSPYLVQQRFFPNALQIQDSYQPVILMDWVDGRPFRDIVSEACEKLAIQQFIKDSNSNHNPVLDIAFAFEHMVDALQAAGIAHGDLQHDNIIVRNDGSLCLVDYDSIFVPGMTENDPCPVNGVEGYGHPDYVSGKVGRLSNIYMDTFSATVIAASLHILAATPKRFDTNTKHNLLFSSLDIEDIASSSFVNSLRTEFSDEPIASLLSAMSTMRNDRHQAQVLFASIRSQFRSRVAPPSRYIIPTLPAQLVTSTWERFAPAEFASSTAIPATNQQELQLRLSEIAQKTLFRKRKGFA